MAFGALARADKHHENDAQQVNGQGHGRKAVPFGPEGILFVVYHHHAGGLVQQRAVKIQAGAHAHGVGGSRQRLRDAKAEQDGEHNNAHGNHGAHAVGSGEDGRGYNAQQAGGEAGFIAAQLYSLADDGAGNARFDQNAAKPASEDDVHGRRAKVQRALIEYSGVDIFPGDNAADGANGAPQHRHDKQPHHQVAALGRVYNKDQERHQQQNAKCQLHKITSSNYHTVCRTQRAQTKTAGSAPRRKRRRRKSAVRQAVFKQSLHAFQRIFRLFPPSFLQLHVRVCTGFIKTLQELLALFTKECVSRRLFRKSFRNLCYFYKICRVKLSFLGYYDNTLHKRNLDFSVIFKKTVFLHNVYRFHLCRFTIFSATQKNISSSPRHCAIMKQTPGPRRAAAGQGGMRHDAEKGNHYRYCQSCRCVQNHHFALFERQVRLNVARDAQANRIGH